MLNCTFKTLFGIILLSVLSLPCLAEQENMKDVMKLSTWERGIKIESRTDDTLFAYLWFYEWNMFDAARKGEHSRGRWDREWHLDEDGKKASSKSGMFELSMVSGEDSADIALTIENTSDHNWPEIASIIPCFNPGAGFPKNEKVRVNSRFVDRKLVHTYFVGTEGLELLEGRKIYFNETLMPAVEKWLADKKGSDFVFSRKWPSSIRNATCGLMIRESEEKNAVMGIAWDSFLSAQGHNPCRCMHLAVQVGPLRQGEKKTIKGKVYLFKGTKEDCLKKFKQDFPSAILDKQAQPKDAPAKK